MIENYFTFSELFKEKRKMAHTTYSLNNVSGYAEDGSDVAPYHI